MKEMIVVSDGLIELSEKELQTCGGANQEWIERAIEVFSIVRLLFDAIDNYLPHLVSGFKDGYNR